eukprot:CAMPEP_0206028574 /NCGR_PEP_ID=MMETSP1464-20131121/45149_1 /ASSEMBLY_ACC=CAM_ASM_001124 /TAXON_ID=119497 /ORGANISM="Exanthemachrysis gayraliae, Strain RCC1523" /LENGTH=265 /DNA_ID=CAMNT_0053402641 /DNA_START=22 /DNA_END=822 /DNA_ORIENTATION=+
MSDNTMATRLQEKAHNAMETVGTGIHSLKERVVQGTLATKAAGEERLARAMDRADKDVKGVEEHAKKVVEAEQNETKYTGPTDREERAETTAEFAEEVENNLESASKALHKDAKETEKKLRREPADDAAHRAPRPQDGIGAVQLLQTPQFVALQLRARGSLVSARLARTSNPGESGDLSLVHCPELNSAPAGANVPPPALRAALVPAVYARAARISRDLMASSRRSALICTHPAAARARLVGVAYTDLPASPCSDAHVHDSRPGR